MQRVRVYGTAAFTGVQSEYAFVEMADSTLVLAPEGMSPQSLILMADIFPTGYWVARNGYRLLQEDERRSDSTALVVSGISRLPLKWCRSLKSNHLETDWMRSRRALCHHSCEAVF